MEIERAIAAAPQSRAVGRAIAALEGPCIGCTTCRGLCMALVDALVVPDMLARRPKAVRRLAV